MKNKKTKYQKNIQSRTKTRYLIGLLIRYINYLINLYIVRLARKNGAKLGECVTMPYKLAKRANRNLVIGNHTSIQTECLDLRAPIKIGNNVIIGADVEIITCSHDVDSVDFDHKAYGLAIEDYC